MRNVQTQMLVDAFWQAGIVFTLWEVADDSHPYAKAGDDLLLSRHGDRQAFVFRNENGGELLWVSRHENPRIKYRVHATHKLENPDDAYLIVREYSLIFGGDLVA